jgi:hypothetical protein
MMWKSAASMTAESMKNLPWQEKTARRCPLRNVKREHRIASLSDVEFERADDENIPAHEMARYC